MDLLLEKHAEKTSRLSYLHQERLEQTMRMIKMMHGGSEEDATRFTASRELARYRLNRLDNLWKKSQDDIKQNKSTISATQSDLTLAKEEINKEVASTQLQFSRTATGLQSSISKTEIAVEAISQALKALENMWGSQGPSSSPDPELQEKIKKVNAAITEFERFKTETVAQIQELSTKIDATAEAGRQAEEAAKKEIEVVRTWSTDLLSKYLSLRRELLDLNLLYLDDFLAWVPNRSSLTQLGLTASSHSKLLSFHENLQHLKTEFEKAKSSHITTNKAEHDELSKVAGAYAAVETVIQTSGLAQFLHCMTQFEAFIGILTESGYIPDKNNTGLPAPAMSTFDLFEQVLAGPVTFNKNMYDALVNEFQMKPEKATDRPGNKDTKNNVQQQGA